MTWTVNVSKKAAKRAKKLPRPVLHLLEALLLDLAKLGPLQHEWPNYSRLTNGRYHCHLNYSFVVVWEVVDEKFAFWR